MEEVNDLGIYVTKDMKVAKQCKQETHQQIRYANVTSLNFATLLAFKAPDGGVPLERSP